MKGIYYGEYLQLHKILAAQALESEKQGTAAHDEMLFIITHQAYELWFKQILFELQSIIEVFGQQVVEERNMGVVLHRLGRIKQIQAVLIKQIDVIETMTPLDFLDFRDLLVPASGFQSLQFKKIEIMLGVRRSQRIAADQEFFYSRLKEEDRRELEEVEKQPSLFELTESWLGRMPFLKFDQFDFWKEYQAAVEQMLASDRQIIESNPTLSDRERKFQLNDLEGTRVQFDCLFDEQKYEQIRQNGGFKFSHRALLSALFIQLYRDEPILYTGFRYLTLLLDVDQLMYTWRQRHVAMVHRMLGAKIGTGGSSGHEYLKATAERNRVFEDLSNLSTFLIARTDRPVLPHSLKQSLGFFVAGDC
jgi:tryptophan 2,3-dioxygenase